MEARTAALLGVVLIVAGALLAAGGPQVRVVYKPLKIPQTLVDVREPGNYTVRDNVVAAQAQLAPGGGTVLHLGPPPGDCILDYRSLELNGAFELAPQGIVSITIRATLDTGNGSVTILDERHTIDPREVEEAFKPKTTVTGWPVRTVVVEVPGSPYPITEGNVTILAYLQDGGALTVELAAPGVRLPPEPGNLTLRIDITGATAGGEAYAVVYDYCTRVYEVTEPTPVARTYTMTVHVPGDVEVDNRGLSYGVILMGIGSAIAILSLSTGGGRIRPGGDGS